ncbi:MAG: carbon storage regulator [Pirellulaceae bacterium]
MSKIRGGQVHLCIEAPSDISVLRSELIDSPRRSIVLGPFVVHHAGATSAMGER